MFKKFTLQTKMMLTYSLLVIVILTILGFIMIPERLNSYNVDLDNNLSLMANVLSQDKEIEQALLDGYCSDDLMERLDELSTTYDYVVIANTDSIRVYHPDHSLIQEKFAGGDEVKALNGENPYLTTRQGSTASQRRAFHTIYDENDKIIGFIMISSSLSTINVQKQTLLFKFFSVFALALIAGIIISYFISKSVRNSLLGNDPNTFVQMYLQRQEVLDHINEALIAVNHKHKILYRNATAKTILEEEYLPDQFPLKNTIDEVLQTKTNATNQLIEWKEHTYLGKCVSLQNDATLIILRDRTEYMRIDQQLTGTNHIIEALRANTHEFLNKLHVIYGLLQVGEIQQAINFITTISDDVENNYQSIINQIKNTTVAALILGKASHARELGIQFSLRKDSFLPSDSNYLSNQEFVTIVGNLVENAFDAVKNQKDLRQVGLYINEDEYGLTISVDDTGIGMSEEQIQTVLQRQYTTKGDGHGFGLRLIQQITKEKEGYLEIESEINEGSSFTVSFSKKRGK